MSNLVHSQRIDCLSEHCDEFWNCTRPPVCKSCGTKQYSTEEMKSEENILLVEEQDELMTVVKTAEKARLGTFLVVEGSQSKELAKAITQRSKAVRNKAVALGTVAVAAGGTAALVVMESKGANTKKIRELVQKHGVDAAKTLGTGAVSLVANQQYDNVEVNQGMTYAIEANTLYNTGYRIFFNHNGYLVLERRRTKVEKYRKDADIVKKIAGDGRRKATDILQGANERFRQWRASS